MRQSLRPLAGQVPPEVRAARAMIHGPTWLAAAEPQAPGRLGSERDERGAEVTAGDGPLWDALALPGPAAAEPQAPGRLGPAQDAHGAEDDTGDGSLRGARAFLGPDLAEPQTPAG